MLTHLIRKLKLSPDQGPYLGLMVVTALSFGLRFWHIGRFDTFVFDEVYYVKFAQAYLAGMPEFDAHPPLGKYLIAAGLFLTRDSFLADSIRYRWMNAVIGSLVPWLVMGITLTLSTLTEQRSQAQNTVQNMAQNMAQNTGKNWTFACLAGGFVAIDGLFITESRYALINIYLVFFGLLGHWLWLQAHRLQRQQSAAGAARKAAVYRILAGIALGCAIATKWNALGYLLTLLIWELCQKTSLFRGSRPIHLFKALSRDLRSLCFYGLLIPAFTYSALWWPHLYLSKEHMIALHRTLLTFHVNLAASSHPDCSKWYSWPLLLKPIAYWYEKKDAWAYTVNNLGNPALWWLASAAIAVLAMDTVINITNIAVSSVQNALSKKPDADSVNNSLSNSLSNSLGNALNSSLNNSLNNSPHGFANNPSLRTYLLIGYTVNWLPWMMVSRCTFIYLYMPAVIFSFMTLAWLVSEWLYSPVNRPWAKIVAWIMLEAIALSFLFWLPLSLGLPLTPDRLNWRWWLRSWI